MNGLLNIKIQFILLEILLYMLHRQELKSYPSPWYNKHQVHIRKQLLLHFFYSVTPLYLYNRLGPLNKRSSEDT